MASNLHAQAFIFDGEFFNDDWSHGRFTTGVGAAAGTQTGGTRSAGPDDDGGEITGNPGAYRHFAQVHGGRQNGTMTVRTMHFYERFSFDPSLATLGRFDVAFDAYAFSTGIGGVGSMDSLNVGPAIRQGLNEFVLLTGGDGNFPDFDQWTSFDFPDVHAEDFEYVGGVDPPPHLDVSPSGDPIFFGYYAFNSGNFTTWGRGGVDNWALEIDAVPEPPALIGALIVTLAGVGIRLKRRVK